MATQRRTTRRQTPRPRPDAPPRKRRARSTEARTSRPAWLPAAAAGLAVVLLGLLVLFWPRANPAGDQVTAAAPQQGAQVAAAAVRAMRPAIEPVEAQPQRSEPRTDSTPVDPPDAPVEAPKPSVSDKQKPVIAPKPPQQILLVEAAADPPAIAAASMRPLPQFASPSDRDAFLLHLREMLYEGFRRGRDGLASAEKHYQAARALSEAEPRLEYGFGLILWKNIRYDDALARFEEAASAASPGYWPAWQTLIRLQLARRNVDESLARFVDLARALRRESDTSAAADSLECARWMGRLIAFLEQPETDVRVDAQNVAQCDRTVEEILAADLLLVNAYRDGKSTLQADYQAGIDSAEESLAKLQERLESQTAQELKQIEEDQEKQKDQLEKLEMSAAQWKNWIDKETRKYDEQLKKLSNSYQELQIEMRQLTSTILALSQEIAAIQAREFDRDRRITTTGTAALGASVMLDRMQTRYAILERRAGEVQRQGTAVAAARQAAVARYQKATGKLVEQGDSLRKWNDVLANKEESARKQATKSTPEARIVRRQANALSTYMPFDPEHEKQRILDSLPDAGKE